MDLLTSKKFQTAVLAVSVMVAGHFGLDVDLDALLAIVSPLIAYIIGQGVADHGKEKAKMVGLMKLIPSDIE